MESNCLIPRDCELCFNTKRCIKYHEYYFHPEKLNQDELDNAVCENVKLEVSEL